MPCRSSRGEVCQAALAITKERSAVYLMYSEDAIRKKRFVHAPMFHLANLNARLTVAELDECG